VKCKCHVQSVNIFVCSLHKILVSIELCDLIVNN
jgi:hypothetical protein